MQSDSPSGLTSSSSSPPDVEIPHSDTDPDTVNSGDENNVEGEGSSSEDSPASGGAFNPETGEINWDCPCLGGMAHGPCGPEFREAFSCFVYSEDEPKGINCVEKFQNMQNCFRAHPEIYADGGDTLLSALVIGILIEVYRNS
jgi:intermembrane space import and assembly protein 40